MRRLGRIVEDVPVIDPAGLDGTPKPEFDQRSASLPPRIYLRGQERFVLAGLSLSGGGIRSASFSLGVLQAMNRVGVLDRMDYLSTVSGGGYIGAAVTATAHATGGAFVFDRQQGRPEAAERLDISDTKPVRHIRNHSRYLIPRGFPDLMQDVALVVRGIVTNALIVLPYMLFCAALTLFYNPTRQSLDRFGPEGLAGGWSGPLSGLGWLAWLAMVGAPVSLLLFGWSLWRSTTRGNRQSEFSGRIAAIAGYGLLALVAVLFLSFQNWLLQIAFDRSLGTSRATQRQFLDGVGAAIVASGSFVTVIGLFRDQLVRFARDEAQKLGEIFAKYSSKLLLLAAAAVMPAILWLLYMQLVFAGLECAGPGACGWVRAGWPGSTDWPYAFAAILLTAGVALWLLTNRVAPNACSLHRLYRDRLERAFIFDPAKEDPVTGDLAPLASTHSRLSDLRRSKVHDFICSPFPIINTALNVQGSASVNRRGRNADFFSFTPLHAGSPSTHYVDVAELERREPTLNLAAVTAISGAAASSNMGANTIRPLSLTLALLNVRLGYWLPNPRSILADGNGRGKRAQDLYYLWHEMTSGLKETLPQVYLTDGGHIENLGAYELLRRRCALVVAVDAEADPAMSFGAFVALQRYARIDLGIRIEMPWEDIRRHTCALMAANAGNGAAPADEVGPQAALGRIWYDDGTQGLLFYVKSSLAGHENDYIRAYAARNPSFPHETTADQFFSEEQFEAYRALGFGAAHAALAGRTPVVTLDRAGATIVHTLEGSRERSDLAARLLDLLQPVVAR